MAIFQRLSQIIHSNSKQDPSPRPTKTQPKSLTKTPIITATAIAQPVSPTTSLPSPTSPQSTATTPSTPLTPLTPVSPTGPTTSTAPKPAASNPFVIDYRPFLKKWLSTSTPALASALGSPLGLDNWFAHQMAQFFRAQIAAFGAANIQVTLGRRLWADNDTAVDILVSDKQGKLGAVGVRVRCEPGVRDGVDAREEWGRVLRETVEETRGLGPFKKGFEGAVVYVIGVGRGEGADGGWKGVVGSEPADRLRLDFVPEAVKAEVVEPVVMEMVAWHWPEFEKTGP